MLELRDRFRGKHRKASRPTRMGSRGRARLARRGHRQHWALGRFSLVVSIPWLLAALALGACQGSPEVPTPMPATGIFEQIALQGGSVERATSGDAGCPDPHQAPYAIHLRLRVPASAPAESDVYLFTYADRAAWGREAAAFEACRSTYETAVAPAGTAVPHLDISPYRAFGPGWSPEVESALIRALTKAAGSGG